MKPSKSEASHDVNGVQVIVTIRDAVEELRRLYVALQEYSMNNKNLDIDKLLQADSTEDALREQGFPEGSLDDAEIAFISALAVAEREASRVLDAPPGQPKGEKLPEQ